jgi:RNA polymerase sigma factor (TIGR02999 family)
MTTAEPDPPITRLLNLAADGDAAAHAEVMPRVYRELQRIARAHRARAGAGETLRTTALVHEAYLRLVGKEDLAYNGRHHFFSTAARAMHDLLVEAARRSARRKRGGDLQRVELDEVGQALGMPPEDMLALEAALEKLAGEDPEGHEVVMLRYFAGLSTEETAEVLGVSSRTIERRWRFSRAWLARELGEPAR